jgi:thymidylate kinase
MLWTVPAGKRLVALEGLDAAGKGTQIQLLANKLGAQTYKFPVYDSVSGREIVKAFNNPHPDPVHAGHALQALQTVNRLEARPKLKAMLAEGSLVLDRYTASAFAYGLADGLDLDWLYSIIPGDIPQPDVQILIDIPVEESFRRRPIRDDAYEANEDRLRRVREAYLHVFNAPPYAISHAGGRTSWQVVDGCGTVDEVHERILNCIT